MKLELHILREVLRAFTIGAVGTIVLVVPPAVVSASFRLPSVDALSLLSFLPLILAEFLPHAIPIVFLLSIVWALSRLEADGEWMAASMSGRSPMRLLWPTATFALALSLVTWWVFAEGLPAACRAQRTLQYQLMRESPERLMAGRTDVDIGSMHVSSRSRDGADFVDAILVMPTGDGAGTRTIAADRVRLRFEPTHLFIDVENGRAMEGDAVTQVGALTVDVPMEDVVGETGAPALKGLRYQSSATLSERIDRGDRSTKTDADAVRKMEYELHQREANSAACLVLFVIGIPLGLSLARRALVVAVLAAVACGLLEYLLSMRLGRMLAFAHVLSPGTSAWIGNLVVLAIGLPLAWRALRR